MPSKIIWPDTSSANSENSKTATPLTIEYHTSGWLPIAELNRIEGAFGATEKERSKLESKERLFGSNIRSTIKAIRGH